MHIDNGDKAQIIGMNDFMKVHKVKQMYTLLFDYLGDGDFNIQIYNLYGLDVTKYHCHTLRSEDVDAEINWSEYIPGIDIIEDEKAKSLFYSNAYRCKEME